MYCVLLFVNTSQSSKVAKATRKRMELRTPGCTPSPCQNTDITGLPHEGQAILSYIRQKGERNLEAIDRNITDEYTLEATSIARTESRRRPCSSNLKPKT